MHGINVQALLRAVLFCPLGRGRWGLPMFWWGPPGVGKTAQMRQVCEAFGLYLEVVTASNRDPTDFGGLPTPTADGKVYYAPPPFAERLLTQKRGVLFLDEATTIPPAVQAPLLRVTNERVVGDCELPLGIRVIAAGNPTNQAAGGWDLSLPWANRFIHGDWPEPEVPNWISWLIRDGGENGHAGDRLDPAVEEARVLQAWTQAYATAKGIVAGYMQSRSDMLLKVPKEGDPQAGRGWQSPRSWELAARCWATSVVHRLDETHRDFLVTGAVGQPASFDLENWRAEADLPNTQDLLSGKIKWKHEESRLDRTVAVLASCASILVKMPASKDNKKAKAARLEFAGNYWRIVDDVTKSSPDIAWPSAIEVADANLGGSAFPLNDNPAKAPLQRLLDLYDVFKRDGI